MVKKDELNRYISMPHRIEIKESEAGGFFVSIPDLPGCYSQADRLEDAYNMILDAKKAWIESALEDGEVIPEPSDERKHSGKILLRIPPELHAELAQKATLQETSLNQYLIYLLTRENERQIIKLEPHYHKTSIVDKMDVNIQYVSQEKKYGEIAESKVKRYG